MNTVTLQYRIKDQNTGKHLDKMAGSVSYVWNYCNEINQERWKKFRKTYHWSELDKMTAGCSKELGLHSQTVQAITKEFHTRCKQFQKIKLNWRSRKRSLGWVPFKASGVKVSEAVRRAVGSPSDCIRYQGKITTGTLMRQ